MFAAEDPETGEVVWFDTSSKVVRSAFHLGQIRRENEIDQFFRKNSIDRVVIDLSEADQPYLRPLVRFFKQRERKR
ncbi:hypothetical protein BMS3Bbin04_02146 [bacterium BMS3Bbin04]|nr:hypothetical protein BMS3Bbin04_02146 [bacterium BMS3Bbin04]